MPEAITALLKFLRDRRHEVVKPVEVLQPHWDPTFGQRDPTTETIEVIDFDALLTAIDEFGQQLREKNNA